MFEAKSLGIKKFTNNNNNSNQSIIQQTNFVSEQVTIKKTNSSLQLFQCKICLAQVLSLLKSQQDIISPCHCTGSMKYVHNKCLVSWLNTIVKRNLQKNENTHNISCQICKYYYQYQTSFKFQCCKAQEIRQHIKLNWGIFFIGLLFILGAICGCILLGIQVMQGKFKVDINGSQMQILFIASIVLFTVIVIAWSLRLIYILLVRKVYYIKKIYQKIQMDNSQNINCSSNSAINFSL